MILINNKKCNTQSEAVLEYLKTGKQLTQEDAYDLVGTQRLGAIIFNLRKKGYDIYSLDCKGKNRFGNTTNFVKYMLSSTREQCKKIENGTS